MSDSLKKYMFFDLAVFAILIAITEFTSLYIQNSSINDIYFTFSILVSAIVIFRWNIYGLISVAIGYLATSLYLIVDFEFNVVETLLVYYLPYLSLGFISAIFILLKKTNKTKKIIFSNLIYKIMFFIFPFILIGLTKGVFSFILVQDNPIDVLIYFIFRYNFLSIVVTVVLGCFLMNHKNLIYDQIDYIKQLKEEEELFRKTEILNSEVHYGRNSK